MDRESCSTRKQRASQHVAGDGMTATANAGEYDPRFDFPFSAFWKQLPQNTYYTPFEMIDLEPTPSPPPCVNVAPTRFITTDCRSEDGVTVSLIDALIAIARVLSKRDFTPQSVQEALKDLASDEDIACILHAAKESTA
jgi:hypothetical protein